ncbi:MAG: acyl-CoA dehydrogenase family protein [Pseudomonadota bacterium]
MHLGEEREYFRETIRRLTEDKLAPVVADLERTDRFPTELVPILGDLGLLQLGVPEEYGGPGADLTTVCIAKEEMARGSSLAISTLCNNNAVGLVLPIVHFGTEAQKQRYLTEAAKGRTIAAVAMTEPQAGSDVASMRTVARKDGDHYVINGQKNWITWGADAHYTLVFARTSEGRGHNGLSAFLVDTSTPGYVVGRKEEKLGRHGAPTCGLFFEDMRVPADCMIGEEGTGFKSCMRIMDLNRPTVAASALGMAQSALDVSVAYAKERVQFGKPIADLQAIQFKIADMAMKVEACRALLYTSVGEIDTGDLSRLPFLASTCKCFISDVAMAAALEAVQILGSYGYSKEYPAERLMRDAKLNQILEGTNEIHHLIVARRVLAGEA